MPQPEDTRDPESTGLAERVLARLDVVLQQMPAGVVIAEAPTGRVILGNPQVEAIWRIPFLPTHGLYAAWDWHGARPGGRRLRPEEWPLARSVSTGETVEGEEIEIQRGDGTHGVIRISSAPIHDESGAIVAGVATFYDITEQKRQEVARRFLAEAGALLASSLDYQTTLGNLARLAVPALADWCAVDVVNEGRVERVAVEHSDPELQEQADELRALFPPDPDAEAGVARVLRTGRAELIPEIDERLLRRVAHAPEHLHVLERLGLRSAMLVPLLTRGKTLGCIAFASAGSGRRYGPADLELAEELARRAALAIDNARLYRESQAANRAKADFLAVMSHELRTPLTAVIGYAELLELGVPEPVTERQAEHVQRIAVSARHLLTLIEEILTLVSLESGRTRVQPEEVELGVVLREAAIIIEPVVWEKGLRLHLGEGGEGVRLVTDPGKLLQVLLNILSNAVKFTPAGEIHLDARATADACEIRVRDTGLGIAAENLERIFEPFWQAEEPITRQAGGTGMGLAVTRRLAELLGGEVAVESAPGAGSLFVIRIPRQP